jgi:ATP-dependent RNA helicase DBP3
VIGIAETGSGKTMAFAVPCVRGILSLPESQRNKGARAVIVSPTRELAMQSYEQIMQLAEISGLRAVCVYGGVPKDEQRKSLKTADIVVATPGRLNDLINEGYADLSKAKYVVLDEADRMLDKGFEEEIRKIINTTPAIRERQTLMFTATWPESVRSLAATFMSDPVKISIGDNPSGDLRANARIVQRVEVVDPRNFSSSTKAEVRRMTGFWYSLFTRRRQRGLKGSSDPKDSALREFMAILARNRGLEV